jgi:CubicO group peptidase (beta-lactamase class C family)
VTFRHLLTHTARGVDLAQLYNGVLHTDVAPGEKWAYANHGFAVLGREIEDITTSQLSTRMRDLVFQPLGMTSTAYLRSHELDRRMATGHTRKRGHLQPVKHYDRSLIGPGAVRSTIADMARYTRVLLREGELDGQRVFDGATVGEMFTEQYASMQRQTIVGADR